VRSLLTIRAPVVVPEPGPQRRELNWSEEDHCEDNQEDDLTMAQTEHALILPPPDAKRHPT
jgi:hypothetical protein